MADLVGTTVGKYRIVAKLGRGGMAEVYKAYQPGLDRYVGIKVLHAHLVDDQDFIRRFHREALNVGKLRHPNIVQTLDFDQEGDIYFMAMEFIDGPTLKDEIKARRTDGKPFTLKEIARIFIALCSAIDYAHARGMVHRDLKPANVMINQEGQVVLTDFGIVLLTGQTQFTQTGALSGTPAYMSPEQGQGERGNERSDIYSLGVMLYELVTGVVPYDGDTPFAVIMKHISAEALLLPTKLNPDVPESVERVILKAMSKNKEDRYQTAGELARALREAIGLSPGEENLPLTIVAPKPKIEQIDHPTGPLTATERGATRAATARGDGGTVVSTHDTTSTAVAPVTGFPVIPVLIGGVVAFLILIGIIGFLIINPAGRSDQATATAAAITQATGTTQAISTAETAAVEAANATATAQSNLQVAAPAQTAQAAETAAAAETAQAARIETAVANGLVAASAATAEAATAVAATAEAATAEALANVTTIPGPTETPLPTDTPIPVDTPTPGPPTHTPTLAPPTNTPTPERPAVLGKFAFPVDNGAGKYDIFIYSLPDAQLRGRINGARQPDFRNDGQKLLINGEGGGFGENVFEASPSGSVDKVVSDSPTDSYPVYSPDGGRVAYSNPQLALGTDGNYHSYIFVQCGLIPPAQEGDQNCKDVARFGILVPNGQVGEIQGSHPVWTESGDQIVYKGCNTWQGGGSCGIFVTVSWGNKRGGNGNTPGKLAGVDGTSAFPTDTKGGLVAYHSTETGDWEAYVINIGGGGKINISNSPGSLDGLPTFSPDGQWVAFASNREGPWAVYMAPIGGGPVQKLFDFPKPNPWGVGDHDWINERMSWSR